MNKSGLRISNDLRKIFIRLHKEGKTPIQIANILNTSRQTITNWRKILETKGEDILLEYKRFQGHPPRVTLEELKELFDKNKTKTNNELGLEVGLPESAIYSYRKRLGYTYKKGNYTYKEADEELKKNS
jgi:transposase